MSRGKHPIYTRGTSLVQGGENWTGERKFVFFAFKANICLGPIVSKFATVGGEHLFVCKVQILHFRNSEQLFATGAPPLYRRQKELGGRTVRCSRSCETTLIYLYIYPLLVYHILVPPVKFFNKKNKGTFGPRE